MGQSYDSFTGDGRKKKLAPGVGAAAPLPRVGHDREGPYASLERYAIRGPTERVEGLRLSLIKGVSEDVP